MVDKTTNSKTSNTRKTRTRTQSVTQLRGPDFSAEQVAFLVSAASGAFNGQHSNAVQTVGNSNSGNSGNSASAGGSNATSTTRAPRSNASGSATGSRPGRKPSADSGLSKARVMYAKMEGKNRSDIVKAFIDKVGLKDSVANTYYHLIAGKKDGTTRGRRSKSEIQTQAAAA